jgi:hypothetical protein
MIPSEGPPGRIGPLTPFQKPLVILVFLIIPLGVLVVIGSYVLSGEWFYFRNKYRKHSAEEVQFNTTETATTANDLLFELNDNLRALDDQAREIFVGLDHVWHDPANEPAPQFINDFVYQTGDINFLKRYNRVAIDRMELQARMAELETKVVVTVRNLSNESKADSYLLAERLVRKEIGNAIADLKLTKQQLDEVATQFKKGVSK